MSTVASFMLLAHKKGIRIPDAVFTTTIEAMNSQFASYAQAQVKALAYQLPLDISLSVFDGKIELAGHATSRCQDIFKLKEPVERLNAASPGLGWFINWLIARGHSVGMTTYDPCRVASCIGYCWFHAESDLEYVAEFVEAESEEDVTAEQMEQVRNEHNFMPSDVLNSYGGHKNLLCWYQTEDEIKASRPLTISEVRACLDGLVLIDKDRELVESALKFHDLLIEKKGKKSVAPQGWFEHEDNREYELESIGSMAFVVWSESDLATEAVSHYEQNAQSGEGVTDQIVSLSVELDEPTTWARLIDAYKLYIARYMAFSTFIGFLPKE
jgi:PRTRC genetic system protein F